MAQKKTQAEPDDLLSPVEHLVMNGVITLGEDAAYGMEIFEDARLHYPPISVGSVYTSLERLTWKGYLEAVLGEPEPTRGGRARKYYRVTGRGKKVLDFTCTALQISPMPERQRARMPALAKQGARI